MSSLDEIYSLNLTIVDSRIWQFQFQQYVWLVSLALNVNENANNGLRQQSWMKCDRIVQAIELMRALWSVLIFRKICVSLNSGA